MDLNVYSVEWLARERLADARARVARETLLRSALPPQQPLRVALGLVLVRLVRGYFRWVEACSRRASIARLKRS